MSSFYDRAQIKSDKTDNGEPAHAPNSISPPLLSSSSGLLRGVISGLMPNISSVVQQSARGEGGK